MTPGSTSAPARRVSTILPNEARKSIQGGLWRPRKLPATTPRLISISATEIPSSTEARLASITRSPATVGIQR